MIPTFAFPGESAPGQLGPMRRTSRLWMNAWIRSSSWAGTPSVMQMTVLTPASIDSYMASAANGAGTKTIAVFAPVSDTASATVSNTGIPSTSWPPLPGVTPATTWSVRAVPEPVKAPLGARQALDDEPGVRIDEDRHRPARLRDARRRASSPPAWRSGSEASLRMRRPPPRSCRRAERRSAARAPSARPLRESRGRPRRTA